MVSALNGNVRGGWRPAEPEQDHDHDCVIRSEVPPDPCAALWTEIERLRERQDYLLREVRRLGRDLR